MKKLLLPLILLSAVFHAYAVDEIQFVDTVYVEYHPHCDTIAAVHIEGWFPASNYVIDSITNKPIVHTGPGPITIAGPEIQLYISETGGVGTQSPVPFKSVYYLLTKGSSNTFTTPYMFVPLVVYTYLNQDLLEEVKQADYRYRGQTGCVSVIPACDNITTYEVSLGCASKPITNCDSLQVLISTDYVPCMGYTLIETTQTFKNDTVIIKHQFLYDDNGPICIDYFGPSFQFTKIKPLDAGDYVAKVEMHFTGELIFKAPEYYYKDFTVNKETCLITGLNAFNQKSMVYPSVVEDYLNLTISAEKVQVYDMQGNQVMTAQGKTVLLNNLQPGNYIVEIQTEKGLFREKIIKL